MLIKTKKLIFDYILPNIRDMRVVSLLVLGVLALSTSWSGVQLLEINYKLQQEVSALEAKNRITALENKNLALKSEYLKTNTYLELVARQQFGKGAKGETLVLIPKDVALSHAPKLASTATSENGLASDENAPAYLRNLRAWRDFYFPNIQ